MISLKGFSMFRFLFLLLLSLTLSAQSLSLADLAFITQKNDNLTIVFANPAHKSLMIDFPLEFHDTEYMPFFRSMVEINGLTLTKKGSLFVVNVKTDALEKPELTAPPPLLNASVPPLAPPGGALTPLYDFKYDFVSYKLKFLQIDNVKPILEFSGVPYSFSLVSKTIVFKSTKENKKAVSKLVEELKHLDVEKDQVTLKITIFDTNDNKLREVGINPSINFDFSLFSQTGALLTGDAVSAFKGSLKLLSTAGVTKVSQSSSYLISDSDKLEFKKVVSLPFLDENFALSNQVGTNQSKKYKYRDIGFVVVATPTIVGDVVYLDFSLTVGSVLTSGDLPTTSENSIKNQFSAKRGDVIILAGVSKDSLIQTSSSLPWLEDLPILGDIFTHKSDSKQKDFFNVSIEII